MAEKKSQGMWELIKTVFYAVLIALVIRTFVLEPFSIPSGSMIPTLLIGDYLFVSKYSFGYSKHSFPLSMPLFEGRLLAREPARGDVVVFKLPTDNRTDYIKRIIGLPGDTIQLINGRLHVNNAEVPRQPAGDVVVTDRRSGQTQRYTRYVETLPGGRSHDVLEITDNGPFDNTGIYQVPPGHYFALGDNRDSSRDSRFLSDVGYVPFVNLIGRAEFIFFSVDGAALRIWEWPWTLRFDRLFRRIE